MLFSILAFAISTPEFINLTEQRQDVPFNIDINSEAKLSASKNSAFFIYNPEGFTVEYPNGTIKNLNHTLYIQVHENRNPTSDFIIRCEGRKTLRVVLFSIKYFLMNDKYYILMNTWKEIVFTINRQHILQWPFT
ncbi:hypothetical protein TVAG_082460 [Trichomonas vaginalis G3]|uniref:Uncharacterized protein n=1 Tax=Trichomonas vaginalis (strain ATCC PRA-98 / G3) TaxID=412133 RepID=A2FP83_TRIV3|nr:hypothetical protein TVAGG3_0765110 [Trichomonas vaginalis G3]EAX93273.1 hypothetical protein TVAG_082460 [Trichomonas vaginalis G3]KAI5513467.1 hypothetical protein TVAGG3_0765110 [Trichomonas vaginalis G3]|eukprot:XP_001306203.1 hypothetical protein [Trichomonas vaginalis G3]